MVGIFDLAGYDFTDYMPHCLFCNMMAVTFMLKNRGGIDSCKLIELVFPCYTRKRVDAKINDRAIFAGCHMFLFQRSCMPLKQRGS